MTDGFGWLKPFADAANLSYARRFSRIWIPDFEGEENLTDSLSHFAELPRQARYVGPLSRFAGMEVREKTELSSYELLITMSGPEPQRTLLEERLTAQALNLPYKTLMVVGKTENGEEEKVLSNNLHKVSHLSTIKMLEAMQGAKYIVCRSGYSTIMDLVALGKQAAFIPTPGQPEQEFLAKKYKSAGLANFAIQSEVDLKTLLENYNDYKGFAQYQNTGNLLDVAMDEFLTLI